jgi:hypothetical protein
MAHPLLNLGASFTVAVISKRWSLVKAVFGEELIVNHAQSFH